MSFETRIQYAKESLEITEAEYWYAMKRVTKLYKELEQSKYYLLDLEQKAKKADEEAKYVDFPPFVCAIQYESQHSYSREPPKILKKYICKGKHVYVEGTTTPIGKKELADSAHYGSLGRAGIHHRKPIVEIVKKHFLDYLHGKTTETPKPLEFRSSYCGN